MGQPQAGPTTFISEVPVFKTKRGRPLCPRIDDRKARTNGVFLSARKAGSAPEKINWKLEIGDWRLEVDQFADSLIRRFADSQQEQGGGDQEQRPNPARLHRLAQRESGPCL